MDTSLKRGKNYKPCWCHVFLSLKLRLDFYVLVCLDDEIVIEAVTKDENGGEGNEDDLVEV